MSWFRVHRGWMNSPDFAKEPFTEREAWIWLVENAAYESHTRYVSGSAVNLERGQILASQRTLSDVWKWGRQRVRGYLAKLEHVGSLCQNSTHGLTMITICNYEIYQGNQPNEQPSSNPAATQQQPIKEEGKEIKKGKKEILYHFDGRVIRLTKADFDKWQTAYGSISDLYAELQAIDDWISGEDDAAKAKWFFRVSGILKKRNQEYAAKPVAPRIPI